MQIQDIGNPNKSEYTEKLTSASKSGFNGVQNMIDLEKIPEHVAIIMDGNGRWAENRNLPRIAGHNAGMIAMKGIVKAASAIGVKHLTVYAFLLKTETFVGRN